MTKPKLKKIKFSNQLIGEKLPTNHNGLAGLAAENLLESKGLKINHGPGPDLLEFGAEIKTRKKSATSAQTVCTMSAVDIINTPYKLSPVYNKIKQQFKIISALVYDFDKPFIQEFLERAYEHSRAQIKNNLNIKCCGSAGEWAYFEQCHLPKSKNYSFRIRPSIMKKLESMAVSTYDKIFDVV
jgi:hypothetical protein